MNTSGNEKCLFIHLPTHVKCRMVWATGKRLNKGDMTELLKEALCKTQ